MKKFLSIFLSVIMMLSLVSCGDNPSEPNSVQTDNTQDSADLPTDDENAGADQGEFVPVDTTVASLKGPTTMGMVSLMDKSESSLTEGKYNVSIYGTADELVPLIVSGKVDIANVPCNLASVLYQKTEGKISVLGINTLGVLYIVETGDTIKSVEDLRGKTIYSTGKGTTPEYVLNYILKSAGIDPSTDVTVEFKSEATEVAAMLENAENAVAVLPQPYVTVAMTKNDKIRIALDLTDEWEKIDGTQLVTGVTIVRNEFLENNKDAVLKFMDEYAESVKFVNENNDEAAALVGKYDIVAEGVAKKALPYCNIVSVTGDEMKQSIENYLNVLFESDPKSVGGKLPDEAFYYIEK